MFKYSIEKCFNLTNYLLIIRKILLEKIIQNHRYTEQHKYTHLKTFA